VLPSPLKIPLSLYVHFPWCKTKCPYCDFNSHPIKGEIPEEDYLRALIEDLRLDAGLVDGRQISTVFMGGGTPSLFSPSSMQEFLDAANDLIGLDSDAEITMEANPGAVEHSSFKAYRSAGINRISLGVQSFDDKHLKALGRLHDSAAALSAFDEARDAGFDSINIDLMYALPEQSVFDALEDIEKGLALQPDHISHYHLTMEPGTRFGKSPPKGLPDSDTSWEILESCQNRLLAAGYDQYEVSAYAQLGKRCKHNLNYWAYGDYLGVGAGAHGKVTNDENHIQRYAKHSRPARFVKALKQDLDSASSSRDLAMRSRIEGKNALFEFMLNNLRLVDGFSRSSFEHLTGESFAQLEPLIISAVERGLLMEYGPDQWAPTQMGCRFLDDLQGMFLP
jgi:putative oxygen-independent coproporphyrinogen III oxidase